MESSWRIATFNLESFGETGGAFEPPDIRIHAMRPVLEELAADILARRRSTHNGQTRIARTLTAFEDLIRRTPYESFRRAASADLASHRPEM